MEHADPTHLDLVCATVSGKTVLEVTTVCADTYTIGDLSASLLQGVEEFRQDRDGRSHSVVRTSVIRSQELEVPVDAVRLRPWEVARVEELRVPRP